MALCVESRRIVGAVGICDIPVFGERVVVGFRVTLRSRWLPGQQMPLILTW